MARFEIPPDPREEGLRERRKRRQRQDQKEPVPWLWLGLGVLVTIIGIFVAIWLANALLVREPLATTLPTPTVIRLTAPPSPVASPTPMRMTPTPIPTLTPVPTLDLANPPAEITVGYYAAVANTAGNGVTVRGGPSTGNVRLLTAAEGRVMLIIGGPEVGDDFTWWEVRLDDGMEGWVAGDFLAPAPAPEE
jgi:hypothetical protein